MAAAVPSERERGLQYARDWRARMKPYFDAIYGAGRCPECGQQMRGDHEAEA
jgi:hypothetical protein